MKNYKVTLFEWEFEGHPKREVRTVEPASGTDERAWCKGGEIHRNQDKHLAVVYLRAEDDASAEKMALQVVS